MDTESGEAFLEILTLASGASQKLKGTAFTHGKTAIDMKVNGSTA